MMIYSRKGYKNFPFRQDITSFTAWEKKYSQAVMSCHTNLLDVAMQYHDALPRRIRTYLNERGIPDGIINSHLLGWNGWRITIPIYNSQGEVVSFRLAKDPQDTRPAPKMLSSPGSSVELYGWDNVLRRVSPLVICEGEFDRLVLEAQGFAAVTSTGGASTFRPEWAREISQIEKVYVCYDRDNAGRNGAVIVALMIPEARIVELPEDVGDAGDITDYFVRLGRSKEDFLNLLEMAKPASATVQALPTTLALRTQSTDSPLANRIQRIKREVPIEQVIAEYLQLRPSGRNLVSKCPFHEDRIPSFTVYPATGTYHCFGCRAHGDVISFVAAIEQLSFGQALDVLDQVNLNNESRNHKDNKESKTA